MMSNGVHAMAYTNKLILPHEIWHHIFWMNMNECANVSDAQQYICNFTLTNTYFAHLKNLFFSRPYLDNHTQFITRLYETTQAITKDEIALKLGFHEYRSLGQKAITIITHPTLSQAEKLPVLRSLIEQEKTDINYSEWKVRRKENGLHKIGGEQSLLYKTYKYPLLCAYLLNHGANPNQSHNGHDQTVLDKLIQNNAPTKQQPYLNASFKELYNRYNKNPPDKKIEAQLLDLSLSIKNDHICSDALINTITLLHEKNAIINECRHFSPEARPAFYCSCMQILIKQLFANQSTAIACVAHIPRYLPTDYSSFCWIGNHSLSNLNPDLITPAITMRDFERDTCLHLCMYRYHEKLHNFSTLHYMQLYENVALLLKKGAQVNAQNGLGNTPLHLALSLYMGEIVIETHNYNVLGTKIIKLLIKNGANVHIKNYYQPQRKTPIDFAAQLPIAQDVLKLMHVLPPIKALKPKKDKWIFDTQAIALLNQTSLKKH